MKKINKLINVALDADLMIAFEHACRRNNISPSQVLSQYCEEFIRTRGQPDKKNSLPQELDKKGTLAG